MPESLEALVEIHHVVGGFPVRFEEVGRRREESGRAEVERFEVARVFDAAHPGEREAARQIGHRLGVPGIAERGKEAFVKERFEVRRGEIARLQRPASRFHALEGQPLDPGARDGDRHTGPGGLAREFVLGAGVEAVEEAVERRFEVREKRDLRNHAAVLSQKPARPQVGEERDVENDAVVPGVVMMTVFEPCARRHVDLDVARPLDLSHAQARAGEVGAGVGVERAGRDDLDGPSVRRVQRLRGETLRAPEVVHERLGNGAGRGRGLVERDLEDGVPATIEMRKKLQRGASFGGGKGDGHHIFRSAMVISYKTHEGLRI